MQFQKISILPHRRDWNFLGGGGGFCKTKIFKEMYEASLEFPEGLQGPWIFSRTNHNYEVHIQLIWPGETFL